ncbi:ATP-binding cassette domain-containing protein [uncultured Methanomethylovorans sp.]|uniref:ATP-binding cassette domain-containing protein n=1 Tax=uncultured Methanomethylovorans sp. TaxID=183759 RepID=UPI002AA68B3C|nr:ATP-binding cassette domain-containing protein [uncultured Methanomethylovorans sp.]
MISIEDLSYSYPDGTNVLDSIDLELETGEFVVLVGPNGCGKSTLSRHLNGLLRPTAGSVKVMGMDTRDPSSLWRIRQAVGMVFQDPNVQFIGSTLEEDIAFGLENLALPAADIKRLVSEALEITGMDKYRHISPSSLSGGQKQKAAIAGSLAMGSKFLVLDEVSSMLDLRSCAEVLNMVISLKNKGIGLLYITHRPEEIIIADRILVMDQGRIVADGMPLSVIRELGLDHDLFELPPLLELALKLEDVGVIHLNGPLLSPLTLAEEICRSL